MLDDIERRYPAKHYVMVDDKLRILTAMKAQWQQPDHGIRQTRPLCARSALDCGALPRRGLTIDRIAAISQRAHARASRGLASLDVCSVSGTSRVLPA
jgi:hypothetical protein